LARGGGDAGRDGLYCRILYVQLSPPNSNAKNIQDGTASRNSATAQRLSAEPHSLETFLPETCSGPIVIDEVQRVPELLNEVHRLIDLRQL
jgi:hypothetical protein